MKHQHKNVPALIPIFSLSWMLMTWMHLFHVLSQLEAEKIMKSLSGYTVFDEQTRISGQHLTGFSSGRISMSH